MTGSSGQAHLFYRLRSSYSQPVDINIISRSVPSFECVVTNRLRNFGNRRSKWNVNAEPTPSSTTNDQRLQHGEYAHFDAQGRCLESCELVCSASMAIRSIGEDGIDGSQCCEPDGHSISYC